VSTEDNVQVFILITFAVLVAASLFSRRIPVGNLMRMLLGWIAVFAVLFVAFSYRDQAKRVWKQVKSEFVGGNSVDEDGSLRVKMSEDGHFWLDAVVNGQALRMMVDSGATETSLGFEQARSLGIKVDETGFAVPVDTANGTVKAYKARIETLKVGPIVRRDFGILVSQSFGDTTVIGMDFLTSLDGWRVEGRDLILNPETR
jgi:aspartyl protease family protein